MEGEAAQKVLIYQEIIALAKSIRDKVAEEEELLLISEGIVFREAIDILYVCPNYNTYIQCKAELAALIQKESGIPGTKINTQDILTFCKSIMELLYGTGAEMNKAEKSLESSLKDNVFTKPLVDESDYIKLLLHERISCEVRKFIQERKVFYQEMNRSSSIMEKLASRYKDFRALKEKVEKREQEIKENKQKDNDQEFQQRHKREKRAIRRELRGKIACILAKRRRDVAAQGEEEKHEELPLDIYYRDNSTYGR